MKKEKKDKNFIKKPYYKGGGQAMKKFVGDHLKYPKTAFANKIEGVVKLKYTIDQHGKVINTKVIKRLGYGCDEEAERVVRLFKFELPKIKGMKVQYHKNININFKLPKPSASPQKVVYKITKEGKKETESSNSYNYSIKW